jgi:hypothetical protein
LGTKNKHIIFLVGLLLSAVQGLFAQSNMAFYPLDDQANSAEFNPAFLYSPQKYTLSIFPIGGMNVSYNNQQVVKDLVKQSLQGITSDDDYKKVLKSITDRPYFNQNIESILLSFTMRTKLGFFNFRVKENQNFSAAVHGELSSFVFSPDLQSATINQVQELPAQGMHYREYSLGYSLSGQNRKFTFGIRPKIYFGKAAFYSGLSASIQKETDGYFLNAGGKIKLSMPMNQADSPSEPSGSIAIGGQKTFEYLLNSDNRGFGLDLGFKYRISPDLMVSASALDWGKIDWDTDINSKIFDGEYPISNKKVDSRILANGTEVISKNFSNYSFSDSISNNFKQTVDTVSFSGTMPLKIFGGIKYRLNPKAEISLTDRYVYLKYLKINSISLMLDYAVTKDLTVCSGYSIIGNSYTNLPVAILFRKEFGQIYLGTENLLSLMIPSISDFSGFSFGTCFYLFHKKKSSGINSRNFPFYRARNPDKDQKTGLILKED